MAVVKRYSSKRYSSKRNSSKNHSFKKHSPSAKSDWDATLEDLVEKGALPNAYTTKVVIISGTHGEKDGKSGFGDAKNLKPEFFQEDLKKAAEFRKYPNMYKITFTVLDMKNYINQQKDVLLNDIRALQPTQIFLAWCFSYEGDVHQIIKQEKYSCVLFKGYVPVIEVVEETTRTQEKYSCVLFEGNYSCVTFDGMIPF